MALIQFDWCPYKKRRSGHRRAGGGWCEDLGRRRPPTLGREAPGGTSPVTPWRETPNLRQSPSLSLPRSHRHPQLRASPSSPAPASLKCLPGAQRTQPSPAATGPGAASAGSFTRVPKEPLPQATPSQAWRGGTQRGRGGV